MSHGGGGEEGGDPNRWLVSYADFITLLMVLFVVLYSLGQTDIEKYKKLADSFKAAFSSGTGSGAASKVLDTTINQGSGSDTNGVPDPIEIPGIPKKPPSSVQVASQLNELLKQSNLDSSVSVQTSIDGVLISISEKLTFSPGTVNLRDEAYSALDVIINMIQPMDNEVKIIGFTDNTPPADSRYSNNWELSTGRAWVIAKYMIEKGIAPERLIVSGRGEYNPLNPNDTPEHRSLNNRAEIIIVYKVDSNVVSGESPLINPGVSPTTAP